MKSTYQSLLLAFIFLFAFVSLSFSHNTTHDSSSNHNDNDKGSSHNTTHDSSSNLNGNDKGSSHNTTHNSSSSLNGNYKGCFSKVYAFGESDTDTGNAHFLGSFAMNSTTRLSDGQLVLDFVCEALSLPPVPPYKEPSASFKHGINFAIAGSTALSRDYFVKRNLSSHIWKGCPMSFLTQIEWFEKYLAEMGCKGNDRGSCKVDMDNSLFWIGDMGMSDYTNALGSSVSLDWLTEIMVKNAYKILKALLASGAKYVVVQGLPPVGCFPLYMSSSLPHHRDHMGCAAAANKAIMIYNKILQKKLEEFRKMHPDSSVLYADYWNAYLTVLMNPKKYHIEEAFKPCCPFSGGKINLHKHSPSGSHSASICKDPRKYINWDGIHLTEAMYKNLANLFLNQGFCHPSFDELVKSKKSM